MKKFIGFITIVSLLFGLFACETSQIDSVSITEETTTTVAQGGGKQQGGDTTSTTVNGGGSQQGGDSTTSTSVASTTTTIQYVVSFDSNGGSGSMDSMTLRNDERVSLPACAFTKTGYVFVEWNNRKDGTGRKFVNESMIQNLSASNGQTIKMYAQWKANSYKVIYNANDGSDIMLEQDFVYDVEQQLIENTFTAQTGMRFWSWNTESDGTGTSYSDGENVLNLTATADGTVILYAQWIEKDAHGITYQNTKDVDTSVYPRSFKENEPVTLPTNVTTVGYTFNGWWYNGEYITGWEAGTYDYDIRLEAQWTVEEYNIYYRDESDELLSGSLDDGYPTTHQYDETTWLRESYKDGYHFRGWYDNPECNGESISYLDSCDRTSDVTLYAKWEARTYNVVLEHDNGEDNTYMTVTYGIRPNDVTPPQRVGYTFHGYYTEYNGSGNLMIDTDGKINESCEEWQSLDEWNDNYLYAYWTANIYTIYYRDHGDAEFSGTNFESLPKTHRYDEWTNLVNAEKDGYYFMGWYDNTDCTGDNLTSLGSYDRTSDITLYAKWNLGNGVIQLSNTTSYSDQTITITYDEENNLFTATVDGWTSSYYNNYYYWYVDGELKKSKSKTYSPNIDALSAGKHSVTMIFNYSTTYTYSETTEFTVLKSY